MNGFEQVRVRVAPSPTGDPHVGTAYVSVFNYVMAKKHGGAFILRVEDTDQQRCIASSERLIYDSLRWLGLEWDEGPDKGGPYGPYRQSERREIHKKYAEQLIREGKAYPCFCTTGRLTEVRERQKRSGLRSGYDGHCRSLSPDQLDKLSKEGRPSVIRLRVPDKGVTRFTDAIRGEIEIKNSQLDDQILLKSDGFPTYHLANVVDDHLMKISHVIRAEEWISSTPKHVLLYQAFGWQLPAFVHVPILRNPDRSKISKRRNPVSLSYYRQKGILPEAMVNFLALMGWSYGEDQEIFSLQQMQDRFQPESIHPGGPVFDQMKLSHVNQHYISKLSEQAFVDHLQREVFSTAKLRQLYPLFRERLSSFDEFTDKAGFLFCSSPDYSQVSLVPKGRKGEELRRMLAELLEQLDQLYDWKAAKLQKLMDQHRNKVAWKPRDYFMSIRMVATGRRDSPPLAESLESIGREFVRFRVREAMQYLARADA